MVKKLKNNDFFYKLLSLVIALGLWFYVGYTENPDIEVWFHGVSVVYTGDNALESNGLVRMTDDEVTTVSLKVKGSRGALFSLSSRDITATVDVSTITSDGTFSLPINVTFHSLGFNVVGKDPVNIPVTTQKLISSEKPVRVEYIGSAADGISVVSAEPSVKSVTVSGPQSVIEDISECVAQADISKIVSSGTAPVKINLKMSDGTVTDDANVSLSNAQTDVTFTVKVSKTLPVKADIKNIDDFNVKRVNITPKEVTVVSEDEIINNLTEIMTEPFSISESVLTYTKKLNLPNGIECESEEEVQIEIILQ